MSKRGKRAKQALAEKQPGLYKQHAFQHDDDFAPVQAQHVELAPGPALPLPPSPAVLLAKAKEVLSPLFNRKSQFTQQQCRDEQLEAIMEEQEPGGVAGGGAEGGGIIDGMAAAATGAVNGAAYSTPPQAARVQRTDAQRCLQAEEEDDDDFLLGTPLPAWQACRQGLQSCAARMQHSPVGPLLLALLLGVLLAAGGATQLARQSAQLASQSNQLRDQGTAMAQLQVQLAAMQARVEQLPPAVELRDAATKCGSGVEQLQKQQEAASQQLRVLQSQVE